MKYILFTLFSFGVASFSLAGSPTTPDERDRDVFEALLLHLLSDPEFNPTMITEDQTVIVLHQRTPEKTGFIQDDRLQRYVRNNAVPTDAARDLQNRNVIPHTYDAVEFQFSDLTFNSQIVVTDISSMYGGSRAFKVFQDSYPTASGWIEPYLPGYSRDGKHALVRAGYGPSSHAALLTALLRRDDDVWKVEWYHLQWLF